MPRYDVITIGYRERLPERRGHGRRDAHARGRAARVCRDRAPCASAGLSAISRHSARHCRSRRGNPRLASHDGTRRLPRRQPSGMATIRGHERGARSARGSQPPRHPVEHRRRSSRRHAQALYRRLRHHRHSAAAAVVQAGTRALSDGARSDRPGLLAARGREQFPRHRAHQHARHRQRLDQSTTPEPTARRHAEVQIRRPGRVG